MESYKDRFDFSNRLKCALVNAKIHPCGPSRLRHEFNFRSDQSITIHAARKWLIGDSIPTQRNLRTLADWLGVRLEWLRFGNGFEIEMAITLHPFQFSSVEYSLLVDLNRLDDYYRNLAREFIRNLIRNNLPR